MITDCIAYYKNLYKWKKIIFVFQDEVNNDLLTLFEKETKKIDNIEKYIAVNWKNINNKNVIIYEDIEQLMKKVDEIWAFKLVFLSTKEIKIWDIYSSVLTKEFINKLKNKWILENKELEKYNKLFELLNKSKSLMRMHFVNLKEKWAIFDELFRLQWAWEKKSTVLLKEDNVYYPDIKKPENNLEENYILNLFNENKKYLKKNEIDLEKDDLYLITMEENNIPIWMFELKTMDGTNIKEFWTFALDKNLHWKDIFSIIFQEVLKKLNQQVIIVSWNKSIQNFLEQKKVRLITEKDKQFSKRFEEMKNSNIKDGKWRKMYLYNKIILK